MVWPLVAAAGVNAFLQQQNAAAARKGQREQMAREDARRRREGAAGILQSNAASLGAPTYNVRAAGIEADEVARHQEAQAAENLADQQQQQQNVSNIVNFMTKAGMQEFGGGDAAAAGAQPESGYGGGQMVPFSEFDDEDDYGQPYAGRSSRGGRYPYGGY